MVDSRVRGGWIEWIGGGEDGINGWVGGRGVWVRLVTIIKIFRNRFLYKKNQNNFL